MLGNASCKCLSGLCLLHLFASSRLGLMLCCVLLMSVYANPLPVNSKKQNINFLYPTDWPSQCSVALGYFSDSDILIKTNQAWWWLETREYSSLNKALIHCLSSILGIFLEFFK